MDQSNRIISSLANDEDFRDLLVEFVREMPSRIALIAGAIRAGDMLQLRRVIHQLKGACGGYGFPSLTEQAGKIESMIDAEATFGQLAQPLGEFVRNLSRIVSDPE